MNPLAHEFFAAMTDLLTAGEPAPAPAPVVAAAPRKPISCHACLDTGDTESGRACGWCSIGGDSGGDDLPGNVEDY
jgi:hypothetical protein